MHPDSIRIPIIQTAAGLHESVRILIELEERVQEQARKIRMDSANRFLQLLKTDPFFNARTADAAAPAGSAPVS